LELGIWNLELTNETVFSYNLSRAS
jgi:hypothetical protein